LQHILGVVQGAVERRQELLMGAEASQVHLEEALELTETATPAIAPMPSGTSP
jgi:hypothetical protein